MLLEICTNSYQSAINAQNAGANRIELCSELSLGGITPSYGLIKQVIENISIPVFVLIRPRSGNFIYTNEEFEIIKKDVEFCKKAGCAGVVTGILSENGTIDIERTKVLLELARPLDFTFHRAFDCVKNPEDSLIKLKDIGVKRILSSGLKPTVVQGIKQLIKMKELGKNQITIMPGSGINPSNISLLKKHGFTEIHTSASKVIEQKPFFTEFETTPQTVSDYDTIKSLLKQLNNA
ncbi:copper homeostasis protein [Tenacibaculum sp. MAR_2009_124]|uniref:copper homeostasis protein CutC n=1 Tax=Tenacibaculum sp. MAR_2009_124 TaxID=1250059 RepID=UPI0008950ABF|nr:copper homeostasis protein CutC [Tenacibaculum sp. MAR_2009_124]SEB38638.1 copper homeostasis protein [Tenacibaculum sp. MAR_2009_124]